MATPQETDYLGNAVNPSTTQNVGTTALNNTPVNTTPSASSVANSTSANIPTTTSSGTGPSQSILGISQGLNESQANVQAGADTAVNNAQQNYDSTGGAVQNLINTYLGKGQDQLNLEAQNNIPQDLQTANDLTTQYQTKQLAYNNEYNAILNQPGLTAEQSAQQIDALTQEHSYDLANTGILQAIAQNQYQTAQTLVNHQIDVKYAPIKDAIDYGMQFLANNKDILTQAQQNQFQTNLAVQNQQYTEASYNDHLLANTKISMLTQAASNGAPSDVLQGIQSAQDLGTAASSGGQYLKDSSYQPIQTGIDENTGLPIYSTFNTKTGALETMNPGNALGATGSQSTVVNGYQMGATTTLGAYASATNTQVSNIKNTVTKIQSTVGSITDPTTAQAAIDAVAPNSPITGAMVMSAATQYGVDPATIIGVMQAETQCGTDGSAGSKGANWGNVGNTDAAMAQGKPISMKPQQGVDAVAKNLAQRQVTGGQTDPAQPANTTGMTPTQIANQTIKNAPTLVQSAMSFLPSTGDVYIDSSKLTTDNQKFIANSYVANSGGAVKLLTGSEASEVQDTQKALGIIQNIYNAFTPLAPSNRLGALGSGIMNSLGSTFGTDKGNAANAYNEATLAGGLSALGKITDSTRVSAIANAITEASLPTVGKETGWGTSKNSDTYTAGIDKLNTIINDLNTNLQSVLPNSQGLSLFPTTKPTSTSVTAPDGQQYVITP